MQELAKFVHHIHILEVCDTARQLTQLAHLKHKVLADLIQVVSDKLKRLEVPLLTVGLEIVNVFAQFLKLIQRLRDLHQNTLLPMLTVFQVTHGFLLKVAINELTFYVSELCEKRLKFFIVVVFDTVDFLTDSAQFTDLVVNLVLKLGYLVRQLGHVKLV